VHGIGCIPEAHCRGGKAHDEKSFAHHDTAPDRLRRTLYCIPYPDWRPNHIRPPRIFLRWVPLHGPRGGSSATSLIERDSDKRLLGRSIPPLALRARVCLRSDNRHRTSPPRNLSERSPSIPSRIIQLHFMIFLTSSTCLRT
jgi:hypothetical protein